MYQRRRHSRHYEGIPQDYTIIDSIGHPGGFADVFEAKSDKHDEHVAIKIYRNAQLTHIQREIDPICEIQHANIVRIHGSGKSPSGHPYIIMELLRGETLDSFRTPANALAASELHEVAEGLLSALVELHPDRELALSLRGKDRLSDEDFAKLQRARHGYIHRDLKPENIVLVDGRGPVIIDFNISSPAGQPVTTMSHTNGYLPLGRTFEHWDPSVDLYALGITLAEIGTGLRINPEGGVGPDALTDQLSAAAGSSLGGFVEKLCGILGASPFESARAARKALRRLTPSG